MSELLQYILREAKSNRLSKQKAAEFVHDLQQRRAIRSSVGQPLHPLVHRNTSTLERQRYSSWLQAQAFYLQDHVVQGRCVLPAVAQLELARAAVQMALEAPDMQLELHNVVFARPVVVGEQGLQLHIVLESRDDGAVEYELYSEQDGQQVVHGQGRVVAAAQAGAAPGAQDLQRLQAVVGQGYDAGAVYEAFERRGLSYGPCMRAIHSLQVGRDGAGRAQVLARLQLPEALQEGWSDYVLHPSMMDGALQSVLGLVLGQQEQQTQTQTALPFALQRLSQFRELPRQGWVVVRHADDSDEHGAVQRLDIELLDDGGQVCVRLHGFSVRQLAEARPEAEPELLLLLPRWVEQELPPEPAQAAEPWHQWVALCGDLAPLQAALQQALPQARVLVLHSQEPGLAQRYSDDAWQLLQQLQLLSGSGQAVQLQLVVPAQGPQWCCNGLLGLLKSAQQESPKLRAQLVGVDEPPDAAVLARWLKAEAGWARDTEVRYLGGQRQVRQLQEQLPPQISPFWREQAVYLITGGAGGLGLAVARDIAASVSAPRLVLCGRSAEDAAVRTQLQALQDLGAEAAEYRAVDVGDAAAVQALVQEIVQRHGRLDGVIHVAGVVRDGLLRHKSEKELREVLQPKVQGLVALDEATAHLELDCFVCFSSIVAQFGNAGQADYAAGNAFMDAYMELRQQRQADGRRHGRSLSINWPLWVDGGMQIDALSQERMWRTTGMMPLGTGPGLQALSQAMRQPEARCMVLWGERHRLQRMLAGAARPQVPVAAGTSVTAPALAPAAQLEGELQAALIQLMSVQLKLRPQDIDVDSELSEFGFDSITLTGFGNELNAKYGLQLSPTSFFEHPTVRQLAQYLASEHASQLAPHFAAETAAPAGTAANPQAAAAAHGAPDFGQGQRLRPAPVARGGRHPDSRAQAPGVAQPPQASQGIAIIGISGRYPKADNLAQLWDKLRSGVDCISPVPGDRWPLDGFYSSDRAEARRKQHSYLDVGGFMDAVNDLDVQFFAESSPAIPATASELLLLESAWHLLESAGYTRDRLQAAASSQVGVFVGAMPSPAGEVKLDEQALWDIPQLSLAGLPHRISRFLRLSGPSVAIDTQSSSSMTAVHLACESIRRGECRMAIAGGVTVLSPDLFRGMSQLDAMGTSRTSRSFLQGDGLIPAEGAGLVLLKPLDQAVADGDDIVAVIKATCINYAGEDGPPGVPNVNAQAGLFLDTLQRANINPRTLSYVEAAAYGSPLGDAIEVSALTRAFRRYTDDVGFCAIGSVKANIGHAIAASGISQLAKVVLQLRSGELAPMPISAPLNSNIHFSKTPFRLQTELQPWQRPTLELDGRPQEVPRRAMVNSFGAGGAYACAVIEEFVAQRPMIMDVQARSDAPHVFVLSAPHQDGVRQRALQMLHFLRDTGHAMRDIAFSLQEAREPLAARLAIVASTRQELVSALEHLLAGEAVQQASGPPLFMGDQSEHQARIRSLIDKDAEDALVARYIEQRDLSKLALYWVAGSSVPWRLLYEDTPRRVPDLPLYPFARRQQPAGDAS